MSVLPAVGENEALILRQLWREGPSIGWAFIEAGIAKGSAYTTLGRMVEKGWVSRSDEPEPVYRLTETGQILLELIELWTHGRRERRRISG